jgi:hypothetical protein
MNVKTKLPAILIILFLVATVIGYLRADDDTYVLPTPVNAVQTSSTVVVVQSSTGPNQTYLVNQNGGQTTVTDVTPRP